MCMCEFVSKCAGDAAAAGSQVDGVMTSIHPGARGLTGVLFKLCDATRTAYRDIGIDVSDK